MPVLMCACVCGQHYSQTGILTHSPVRFGKYDIMLLSKVVMSGESSITLCVCVCVCARVLTNM